MAELSPSLVQDVLAGDPSAAAELQRMQEADVRRHFQGPRKGVLSSILARALLGRSRSPAAALTREEERVLGESRPDLRYESAAANPQKTYPGSKLLTTPAIAALPVAGAGAGLGYLAASQTDLPAWAKSLITAGSAGLGGVVGSTAAHALRQGHARALRREHPGKTASLVETLVPHVMGVLSKTAINLGWVDDATKALGGSADDIARAAGRAAEVVKPVGTAAGEAATVGLSPAFSGGSTGFMPTVARPGPAASALEVAGPYTQWPQPINTDLAGMFSTLKEAPMGFKETAMRLQRGLPVQSMDLHNLRWMNDTQGVLARASVLQNTLARPGLAPDILGETTRNLADVGERASSLGVRSLLPRAGELMRQIGVKLGEALPEPVLRAAADELSRTEGLAAHPSTPSEPEDVRRVRRFRDLINRLFRRSRTMRTVSVVSDLDPTGELAEHLELKERAGVTEPPRPLP